MREELVHPYHESIAVDLITRFEKAVIASKKPDANTQTIERVQRLRAYLLTALTKGDTGKGK